ncbi:MAG: histidinol-phosphate transaminase [Pseudomonadota bacterium]
MTTNDPQPKPGVMTIAPYVPGDSSVPGTVEPIKLSSNESPLGACPAAREAAAAAIATMDVYPDGAAQALREAIAEAEALPADQIVCGAGSDELIALIANAYLREGDEAIHTAHGFLMYNISTRAAGGVPVPVPERDLHADMDAILAAVTPRTKLVFLANPNNPTGTYVPFSAVRRLREGLPPHVILVLDAAYCEYVQRDDYENGAALVAQTHNTIMTRTFSKLYGLAGLRLGWAYCPPTIAAVLERVRGPFNVTSPALAAGTAAIRDRAFIAAAVDHNTQALAWLEPALTALGLRVTPSVGNFVLIHFEGAGGAKGANAADAFLRARGIILRKVAGYGLPGALRMTVGTDAQNRAVVDALTAFTASVDVDQAQHGDATLGEPLSTRSQATPADASAGRTL